MSKEICLDVQQTDALRRVIYDRMSSALGERPVDRAYGYSDDSGATGNEGVRELRQALKEVDHWIEWLDDIGWEYGTTEGSLPFFDELRELLLAAYDDAVDHFHNAGEDGLGKWGATVRDHDLLNATRWALEATGWTPPALSEAVAA